MDDWRLLQEWVEQNSEAAFAALVSRHLNLVYSAALRRVKDHEAAEEVVQSVFCLLARKSRHLPPETALVSWLYRTACFMASRFWREERRRRAREQEAFHMNFTDADDRDAVWAQLAPCLDDAMQKLDEEDRLAVLLRFFQGKAWREIGEGLGIGEDAARMRVNRAIERLRGILGENGVACSGALLGTVLLDKVVEVAPASLLNSVQAAGISAAKAGGCPAWLLGVVGVAAKAKLATLVAAALALLLGVNWAVHAQRKARQPDGTSGPVSMGPVSMTLRSLRIDPGGSLAAMIVVTNEGRYPLDFTYGVQIQVPEGWAHTNGKINQAQVWVDDYHLLEPGEERLVALRPPAFPGPWRAFVVCTRGDLPWDPNAARSFFGPALQAVDPKATNSFVETTNLLQKAQELDALGRSPFNFQFGALHNEAIRLNPTNAFYYLNRAAARRHAHDLSGAIADLDKAIELSLGRPRLREEARKWKTTWTRAPEDQQYENLERDGK